MKKASFDDLFNKRVTTRKPEDAIQVARAMRFCEALIVSNLHQTEAWVQAFGQTGSSGQPVPRAKVHQLASKYANSPLVKRLLRQEVAQLYSDMRDPKTGALSLLQNTLRTNLLDLWRDDDRMKSVAELRQMPLWFQLQIEKLEQKTIDRLKGNGDFEIETHVKASMMGKSKSISQLATLLKWAEKESLGGGFSIADLVEDAERARAESARLSAARSDLEGEFTRL